MSALRGGDQETSQALHPLTPSLQAACGATSGPVPPTAPTCPHSATPRTGTCWWMGAMSTTCQVSKPTRLAGPLSVSESVCACLCLCIPLGRLPMAIRACQHDALRLPAPAVRPQGWAPPHGRRLHQQPARQVAARSLIYIHVHTGKQRVSRSMHRHICRQAPRRTCVQADLCRAMDTHMHEQICG